MPFHSLFFVLCSLFFVFLLLICFICFVPSQAGGLDEYEELLWSSNERAIRSVYALSPKYSGFVLRLLGEALEMPRYAADTVSALVQLGLQCFFDIVVHRKQQGAAERDIWCTHLGGHFARSPAICKWYLTELANPVGEHQWLRTMMLAKGSDAVRRSLGETVLAAAKVCFIYRYILNEFC